MIKFFIRSKDNDEESSINLLFKKESVMNDIAVQNLITLSDIILTDHLHLDFFAVTYPIFPISPESGMIKIIDDADTLQSIRSSGNSILKHIMLKNQDSIISDILNKYMYGLVSYTLQSYLIGLRDRHPGNIMIHKGIILHIDFGHILGKEPHPITTTCDIKINTDILDVIVSKDEDNDRSKFYLELCSNGIVILRKYFSLFFVILSENTDFDPHILKISYCRDFNPDRKMNLLSIP